MRRREDVGAPGGALERRRRPRGARSGCPGASDRTSRWAGRWPAPRARACRSRSSALGFGAQRAIVGAKRPPRRAASAAAHRRRNGPPRRPPAAALAGGCGKRRRAQRRAARERRRPRRSPPARAGTRAARASVELDERRRARTAKPARLTEPCALTPSRRRRASPGEGEKDVLERRVVGGEPPRLEPARGEPREQRRHGAMHLAHGQPRELALAAAHRSTPGRASRSDVVLELRRRRSISTTCSAPSEATSSRGGAEREDFAVVDDGDPVAESRRLLHVVRGEEHRAAARLAAARRSPRSAARDAGSSPVVGSSRKRISGSPTSAQASESRCFWPPESVAHEGARLLLEPHDGERLVAARGRRR